MLKIAQGIPQNLEFGTDYGFALLAGSKNNEIHLFVEKKCSPECALQVTGIYS